MEVAGIQGAREQHLHEAIEGVTDIRVKIEGEGLYLEAKVGGECAKTYFVTKE